MEVILLVLWFVELGNIIEAPIAILRSSYNNMKVDIDIREEKY
jgi:hypothetical protein